jgi:GTP-binding protein
MPGSNFVDYVKIYCQSGNGGSGSAHFRREKFEPKGGPDGGDGGRGGHIILRGNDQMWTLLHLKYQRHIFAGNGVGGSRQTSTGAEGKDIIVQVPLGTIAKNSESGEVLFEITVNGEEKYWLKVAGADRGTLILNHPQTRPRVMPNQENPALKKNSYSN